jgi:hypothetical protein
LTSAINSLFVEVMMAEAAAATLALMRDSSVFMSFSTCSTVGVDGTDGHEWV